MNLKSLLLNLGKLFLCSTLFAIGVVIGGAVVTALGLQQPAMPEGMDSQAAMQLLLLESPLLALVLALLARHLAGGFWARTLVLSALVWISNSLNNQIEASAFAGMSSGFLYTIITFLFPSVFISAAVVWLFPSINPGEGWLSSARLFFTRFSNADRIWRMALGAVIFMPIYYFFGLLVIPFTSQYYAQHAFGLEVPPIDRLLIIMFIRSILFLLACAPILIAWQSSRQSLAWRLGLALFYLVGFASLLIANWMPWALRLPHMIEILFDEFVYAGALAWLLGKEERNTA